MQWDKLTKGLLGKPFCFYSMIISLFHQPCSFVQRHRESRLQSFCFAVQAVLSLLLSSSSDGRGINSVSPNFLNLQDQTVFAQAAI